MSKRKRRAARLRRLLAESTAAFLTNTLPNWQHLPPEEIYSHLLRHLTQLLLTFQEEGWVILAPARA